MSALNVTLVSLATAGGLCAAALGGFMLSEWKYETKEEQAARERKEVLQAFAVIGGVIAVGAYLDMKTPHTDIGAGMMTGAGGVASLLVFDLVFPRALARKEGA